MSLKLVSRTQERIRNKLGVIPGEKAGKAKRYRSDDLAKYDKYYKCKQYDGLTDWNDALSEDDYVPLRKRKPSVRINLPRRAVNQVTAKLVGKDLFPKFAIEEDPDTTELIRLIHRGTRFRSRMIPAVRRALINGSSFVRYFIVADRIRIETYNSNYCYPSFDDGGDLVELDIRYVFADEDDRDEKGNPKEKWYRLTLTGQSDILWDNPEYKNGEEPNFQIAKQVDHQMGFVQGVWMRTGEDRHSPDGPSLLEDSFDLADAINYSLSQGDQAVNYAQEPQLGISGMDTDEIDKLIKSSTKAWNLGRDGNASFIEADLSGAQRGMEMRDKMSQAFQAVTRVTMLDPEKIVGSAQSAKAMEVLHGPLVDLVDELRPEFEAAFIELTTKLVVSIMILEERGQNRIITFPPGYKPQNLDIAVKWPPVFPMTMQDLQVKVSVASQASTASLISRETLTAWLARDFGVENVEEEVAKVNAQPVLNPFAAF